MPLPKDNLLFGFASKLTDEQWDFVNSIFDNQLTITDSPAGTGKTTLAVACSKIIGKDLVYLFSPTQEGKMGFRPGTQSEKEKIYQIPLIDALLEIGENPDKVIFDPENMDNAKRGNIWVYPMSHVFTRGTNLKGKTIILDECQNWTKSELKRVLTRIHDLDTKVIMIGHSEQCDLANPVHSGFAPYIEHFRDEPYAKVCNLTVNFRGRLAQHADKLK